MLRLATVNNLISEHHWSAKLRGLWEVSATELKAVGYQVLQDLWLLLLVWGQILRVHPRGKVRIFQALHSDRIISTTTAVVISDDTLGYLIRAKIAAQLARPSVQLWVSFWCNQQFHINAQRSPFLLNVNSRRDTIRFKFSIANSRSHTWIKTLPAFFVFAIFSAFLHHERNHFNKELHMIKPVADLYCIGGHCIQLRSAIKSAELYNS